MKSAVVAFSGGIDSTFLLYAAIAALGKNNVLAVTGFSESYPLREKNLSRKLASRMLVNHQIIKTKEINNKNFRKNPVNRCYYCKKELFHSLSSIARKKKYNFVLDGSTLDDLKDIRYGSIAAREQNIRSPIQEAGLSKADIRKTSKKIGIEIWNKPSSACLASRFAFNESITVNTLKAIEKAEEFMRSLGFSQLRVRRHKNIARIEILQHEMNLLYKKNVRTRITKKLKLLGFTYITFDLEGYRTGSMHEELDTTPSS